jgi:glycosyltransferase involved in cell wall biosynthesis
MAAGLPVAAVDAVGTRDAVEDGKQGWLTENDSQALAEAILRLLENPDARQAFSQAALERAQTFDIQILAKHMLGVYQQAIEDKLAGLNVCVPRHNQLT